MSKILDKIVKLFKLADTGTVGNNQEAEMLSAITKARELMVRHKISEREVQDAVNAATFESRSSIQIDAYTAYTRKMKNLARYDEIVAMAIGKLTDTSPVIYNTRTMSGMYVSMKFVGDTRFIPLAGELFLIWLPEVRRATRRMYGSDKWGKEHTSYAIGYATRIYDRACESVVPDSPEMAQAMVLVTSENDAAMAKYKEEQGITTKEARKTKLDDYAFAAGFIDGEDFNMNTKVMR